MDLQQSLTVSASGMRVNGTRMRVIAQNIANADTAPSSPNEEPYRRKTITFENYLNPETRIEHVRIREISEDNATFREEYDPGHPGANEEGYVLLPNVNTMIESMDMREAQRAYEANLGAMQISRNMIQRTIDSIGGR